MEKWQTPESQLKRKIAEVGDEQHLDRLVNDPDRSVRITVASRGVHRHLKALSDDPEFLVRAAVVAAANEGKHKDVLDHFVHDKSVVVRHELAHGTPFLEHLRKLMDDPYGPVRAYARTRYQALQKRV